MASLPLLSGSAFAHVGHIGELAGHSHWAGAAALAGAAAIAGLLALRGKKKKNREESDGKAPDVSDTPEADAEAKTA
ncbi:MAG: hypothetical protein HWE23_05225 [Rhodobacteraceae bacterium]|nr:hypothetical protein [Paracoccaceae bacterium]